MQAAPPAPAPFVRAPVAWCPEHRSVVGLVPEAQRPALARRVLVGADAAVAIAVELVLRDQLLFGRVFQVVAEALLGHAMRYQQHPLAGIVGPEEDAEKLV